MTAPAPDEGRTERVAALLARHWSYEPTTVYDEWLCECGARIMGGSDGDTDTAMQAHVADQILAVLAAVGPDSTGGQGESVVEWGVRKRQQWSSLGIDRVVVETSWTGHDGWTTGPYDEAECRRLSRSGGQYGEVVTRQRTRYADTVTPWQPVEEAEHG